MNANTSLKLNGGFIVLSLLLITVAIGSLITPSESTIGPLARILDPYSPHILVVSIVLCGTIFALGSRRFGSILCTISIATLGGVSISYKNGSVPINETSARDVRVLFYNVQANNTAPEDILKTAQQKNPDILVFAEAEGLRPAMDMLDASYDFVSPCSPGSCELLVVANFPILRFWQLPLNPIWDNRYAALEFETPNGTAAFLTAVHLTKPWFSGISEAEIAKLTAQYNWFSGPVIAVGDYNMPPWSLPMRRLLDTTGYRAVRYQPGTWPKFPKFMRLPLDQALINDNVQVHHLETFGEDLQSNHLGLILDITLIDNP